MIDFRQKDKQGHFAAGFVLSFGGSFLSLYLGWPVAILTGYLKERYDRRHPETHTYDANDMYATWIGGGVGLFAHVVVRVMLNG